jgi:hypothetical protein
MNNNKQVFYSKERKILFSGKGLRLYKTTNCPFLCGAETWT